MLVHLSAAALMVCCSDGTVRLAVKPKTLKNTERWMSVWFKKH